MKQEIIQKEILCTEEGFWDDQDRAREIMQTLEHLRSEVDGFEKLMGNVEGLLALCEIATTEQEWHDIAKQTDEYAQAVDHLEFYTLFDGEYDKNNAIVTIHSGAGGVDAQDWTQMLLTMYIRWAERRGFTVTILDKADGAEAGVKNVTFEIIGRWAYGHLRAESGVHRLVRLSPFNSDNLRQTSFARVEVMPIVAQIKDVTVKSDELRIDTYRSSGAGGQHVNTTDSAVRVTHIPTGLQAQCQNERSQAQNKENAMKLLMAKLHARYLEEEEKKQREIRGELTEAGWGNQIRSYVLHPYKMVKDHRTKYETTNVADVLDGDLDDLMIAFLRQ
jgi:peptide chain release factor 2